MLSKIVKASVLFTVLSTAVVVPAVAQVRRQEYVVIWYTDETETTISGQRVAFCGGGGVRIGTPTFYEETIYYGCD